MGFRHLLEDAEDVTTLEITCVDPVLNLKLILSYSAFEKEDVITRSVKIVNTGKQQVRLEKVYSACLDMDNENFELLTLHGSWGRERHIQRRVICFMESSLYHLQKENPDIRNIHL